MICLNILVRRRGEREEELLRKKSKLIHGGLFLTYQDAYKISLCNSSKFPDPDALYFDHYIHRCKTPSMFAVFYVYLKRPAFVKMYPQLRNGVITVVAPI